MYNAGLKCFCGVEVMKMFLWFIDPVSILLQIWWKNSDILYCKLNETENSMFSTCNRNIEVSFRCHKISRKLYLVLQLWVGPGSKAAEEKEFFDTHLAPFYRIEHVIK